MSKTVHWSSMKVKSMVSGADVGLGDAGRSVQAAVADQGGWGTGLVGAAGGGGEDG